MNSTISKKQLTEELLLLKSQQKDLQKKIDTLEDFIGVYFGSITLRPKKVTLRDRHNEDFINKVRSIYEINHNNPMQPKEIVAMLLKDGPEENDRHLSNRVMGLIRNKILAKKTYGKYTFSGLVVPTQDENIIT